MPVETRRESVTIYDVAREAGTSKSTVARVLAKRGYVSAETSSAVLDAVSRLGYQPDEQAQRLAKGRFDNVVDIFTAEVDYGIVLRRTKAVQHFLQVAGYDVSYHVSGRGDGMAAGTIQKLRRRKPRAIAACTWDIGPDAVAELVGYMQEGGVVVCFGTDEHISIPCDQVLFDEEQNTYMAVRHLIEMGHRNIGFNAHDDPNPEHPRIIGMRRALAEAGIPFRPEWMHNSRVYEEGGSQLAAWFLALERKPSAMCINNDVVASVFVQQLYRAGVNVPADVSVIGHDDSPIASCCMAPLTVVSQPHWTDSQIVARFLTERLTGEYDGPARRVINCGELVQRESVARL
ncbi:MAG: LacI family DNA-binding transcriptional regulator [Capsulimonadaceae bacterium]|nr:LacI family DNA-binding transcriptional regulator [Capsulimonadaceae bacterium]